MLILAVPPLHLNFLSLRFYGTLFIWSTIKVSVSFRLDMLMYFLPFCLLKNKLTVQCWGVRGDISFQNCADIMLEIFIFLIEHVLIFVFAKKSYAKKCLEDRIWKFSRLCHLPDWNCRNLGHDDVIKWKHFPRYWSFVSGNPPVTGGFPSQRPVTLSFDVFLSALE